MWNPQASFVQAVRRQTGESRALRADVQALKDRLADDGDAAGALSRVAVVRYDAFGDLAGALSFSAALLDDAGNGLVLSSINGRSETRTARPRRSGWSRSRAAPRSRTGSRRRSGDGSPAGRVRARGSP